MPSEAERRGRGYIGQRSDEAAVVDPTDPPTAIAVGDAVDAMHQIDVVQILDLGNVYRVAGVHVRQGEGGDRLVAKGLIP